MEGRMKITANQTFRLRRVFVALTVLGSLPALLAIDFTRTRAAEIVSRGARIRVVSPTPEGRPVIGNLVSLDRDTLVMTAGPDTHVVAMSLSSVHRLDISRARETHRGRYAGFGLLIGAGL